MHWKYFLIECCCLNNNSFVIKSSALKRVISKSSSILLVIGIMIGTGIFKKIVPMASSGLNETYIIAAWILAGLVTLMGALSISALSNLTEDAGGEYEYLRIIFGGFTAFIFGWASFTIIGSASVAAMSFLFTQSFNSIFHLSFLDSPINAKVFSCIVICLLTALNVVGTRKSTAVNNFLTYTKIIGIVILIIGGLFFIQSADISNSPNSSIDFSAPSNLTSIFFAAMLSAFWAYDGWLSVAFMSGEIKNPTRNVAISIVVGVAIVMILYVLINIAFLRVIPLKTLAHMKEDEIAAAEVTTILFGKFGHVFISIFILLCTIGSLNGIIITYSRMYYKMARDGFFFKKASVIHTNYETPFYALIYAMIISCLLVFSGSFDILTDMIVFAGFLFYAMLAIGVFIMKKRGKINPVGIGYPIVPVFFVLFSIVLLINTCISQPLQTIAGVGLMLSGVPFYYYFKFKKRKVDFVND